MKKEEKKVEAFHEGYTWTCPQCKDRQWDENLDSRPTCSCGFVGEWQNSFPVFVPSEVKTALNKEKKLTSEQIHIWYLEACQKIDPASYNSKAQKPFEQLTDQQKSLDLFIVNKINKFYEAPALVPSVEEILKNLANVKIPYYNEEKLTINLLEYNLRIAQAIHDLLIEKFKEKT